MNDNSCRKVHKASKSKIWLWKFYCPDMWLSRTNWMMRYIEYLYWGKIIYEGIIIYDIVSNHTLIYDIMIKIKNYDFHRIWWEWSRKGIAPSQWVLCYVLMLIQPLWSLFAFHAQNRCLCKFSPLAKLVRGSFSHIAAVKG